MNNTPGTGGAVAAGAAEGPGWVCRGHGPSGLRGPGRCLGAVAVMGPAPSKRGDMGEKGAAASLHARAHARRTGALRTGIAKTQSRLPADLSARLPPLLSIMSLTCSCEVNYNESLSGIREEEDFS